MFNFLHIDGRVLGYFQPPSGSVKLERIEPGFEGDMLPQVLVIFVATQPTLGGQRIVGWYQNATVYRREQSSSAKDRRDFGYFVVAKCGDEVLVPETRRTFGIPVGKGAFGQANVCYPYEDDGTEKRDTTWMRNALKYVAEYRP